MSRDPRVFQAVREQTYEQNEDRIRALSSALEGLSILVSEHIWINSLSPAGNERIREEIFISMIKRNLNELTREEIVWELNEIQANLESDDEDN